MRTGRAFEKRGGETLKRAILITSSLLAVASSLVFLTLPRDLFPTYAMWVAARTLAAAALGISASLALIAATVKAPSKLAAEAPSKPVRIPVFKAWERLLLYLDLVGALALSALFLFIMFHLPSGIFITRLSEVYAKLTSALLLGITISLAMLIAYDLFRGRIVTVLAPAPRVARPVRPRIKSISEELPVAFISRINVLKTYAERMGTAMSKDILEAGLTMSPFRLASRGLFFALLAAFISVPVGVTLALLVHPALLIITVAPLIAFMLPKLRLRSAVGERKRALDDELPFFAIIAAILQDAGINLYNALLSIIGRGIFKQLERDALIIKRDVEFFFKSPLEALEGLGRLHPNEKMKGLLLGYTSEWRSGGDIVGFLEAKSDDFMNDVSFKWRTYAERSADVGETIISLFFVFPMLIIMSAFMFPAQAMMLTTFILTTIIPFISTAVFGGIHMTQPKSYNLIGGSPILATVAGAISIIASILLGIPIWLSVAAGLAASTAIYGAIVVLQMREIGMCELALPQFLRDMTEYRKMGYDVVRAFMKICEENTYNSVFDGFLSAAYRQIRLGRRISEVEVPVRSWLTKMCFFIIAQIVESGGGTVRSLEILTNSINRVIRVKTEARNLMRLYRALSIFTPIGLSFVTALMFALLTAFSTALMPGVQQLGVFSQLVEMPAGLIDACYLLTIAASVSVALLTAKTVDLTVKNTVWVAVNLALAAGGITLSTQLAELMLKSMISMTGLV